MEKCAVTFRWRLMVLVVGVALVCSSATAFAGPSVDVALIGSGDVQQGGFLPTSGAGVGDFNFSDLDPADVSAANLVGFDTVVLNAASPEMDCDTGLVSEQGKADLVAFVQNGGKMIIYDSECGAVDSCQAVVCHEAADCPTDGDKCCDFGVGASICLAMCGF